jgi:SSS family solute:Na+ symporter
MAAMMSSVSATFNSASTLVTMDFVKPLVPSITSKGLVRVGQGVTLILVVLASLWAPVIENFGSLWEYLQLVIAYIAPPVAATFIIGLFYGKSNSDGAIAGLIFGFLVSVSVVIAQLTAGVEAEETGYILADIHFLHLTFVVFVLSGLVNIIVSHISKKEVSQEALEQYTWTKKIFIKETEELIGLPWWKNYRIQSIIVLVITAVMVGWLW